MNTIKKIHCFGGSFTEGGGFEFNSNKSKEHYLDRLDRFYSHLEPNPTQFKYSYPGQLQKLFGNKLEVINHAKSGYGNDRMYRIMYDIVNSADYKNVENLFLFEFTGMCRKEIYSNTLQSYITTNYSIESNNECVFLESGKTYFYDNELEIDHLNNLYNFFKEYYKLFVNYDDELNKIYRETEFFISFIEKNNLNYFYTEKPIIPDEKFDKNKLLTYGDGINFKCSNGFTGFGHINELTIKNETYGELQDFHNNYKANKLIAHILYNKIITDYFNNLEIKEIDWDWYKKTNFVEYGK